MRRDAPDDSLSSLALRLEQHGVERLAGGFAGPEDELERLVVAFAGVGGGFEQHLALAVRRLRAAGQEQGVAEHDDVLALPEIEVADPKLLVDEGDQLQDLLA